MNQGWFNSSFWPDIHYRFSSLFGYRFNIFYAKQILPQVFIFFNNKNDFKNICLTRYKYTSGKPYSINLRFAFVKFIILPIDSAKLTNIANVIGPEYNTGQVFYSQHHLGLIYYFNNLTKQSTHLSLNCTAATVRLSLLPQRCIYVYQLANNIVNKFN